MGDYTIKCPNCGGSMDDTNRIETTVLNAFRHQPGGRAYQYVYRCPTCRKKITWMYPVEEPKVLIAD